MVRVVRHWLPLDCILLLLVGTTEMSLKTEADFLAELNAERAAERETADHWRDLAKDRQKRIHELAAQANKFKDEAEALRKDRDRLTYLIDTQAIVESAYRPGKPAIFWLVFPNGEVQPDVFPTAAEAIDAAMDQEASHV